ncbi:MAG: hypothetical protein HAW63_01220 [Bdellovibrionaceae bacterium]|nr:hypothetical protein [Pseudobdellovibrionaceae bacterium]
MNSKPQHFFPEKSQDVHWQEYPVGYVSAAHGIGGDIILHLFAFPVIEITQLKHLRLYAYNKQLLEYEIKSLRPYKQSFLVTCGLENRNKAEELQGSQLWLEKSFLLNQKSGFILQFLGWELFDTNKNKNCGKVVDFGFNGVQNLLVIKTLDNNFFDVPFFKHLDYKVCTEKKRIELSLVEGLEELTYARGSL